MKLRPALFGLALVPAAVALLACSDDETIAPATDAGAKDASVQLDTGSPPSSDAGGDDAASLDASTRDVADSTPQALTLQFQARVGTEPFACGKTFTGVGTSNAEATAGDFRFFVHDVRLVRADASEVPFDFDALEPWQSTRLALLDFENKTGECQFGTSATNDLVKGKAPPGVYTGIVFSVGVPDDLNHLNADTAAAPLPGSKLNWDWTNGFIHFAVQLNSTKTSAGGDGGVERVPSFFSHVGSTECSGDPTDGGVPSCKRKNRPRVRLTGFDPATRKIVIDAKALLNGSNIDENTTGTIPGCMSGTADPECPAVFTRLGLDFATGDVSTTAQTVFSTEPR